MFGINIRDDIAGKHSRFLCRKLDRHSAKNSTVDDLDLNFHDYHWQSYNDDTSEDCRLCTHAKSLSTLNYKFKNSSSCLDKISSSSTFERNVSLTFHLFCYNVTALERNDS